eukprot:COSAG01_NODE_46090_length_403_cov_1.009868_1_plen_76_part_10
MSTENQYHDQAPGWFSLIRGNRDTATAVYTDYSMGRCTVPGTRCVCVYGTLRIERDRVLSAPGCTAFTPPDPRGRT